MVMHTHVRPRLLSALLLIAVTLAVAGCARTDVPQGGQSPVSDRLSLTDVLAQHSPSLMALEGVVGTYEGLTEDGSPCVKVMVVRRTPELERKIPDELGGYPVVIEETGEIRAMPDSTS